MSKIAKKWQITLVQTFTFGDRQEVVELSHDQGKVNWHVTIKGEFYTEFTFDMEEDALGMYNLVKKSSNLFMDSLLIGTPIYKKESVEGGE